MKKLFVIVIAAISMAIMFSSCSNDVRNIPPGYKAKMLTPTGYQGKALDPGQVDIGIKNNDGTSNSLVLLETTSITIKESFREETNPETQEKEDHRVRIADGTPLMVDIRAQMDIPNEDEVLDAAFSSVTPKQKPDDDRMYIVNIQDIYDKFAKMTLRGKVREIFAPYENTDEVMKQFSVINAEIGLAAHEIFKNSGAPCNLIGIQLSNVKEDENILKSKNELIAAENQAKSIREVGKAIREYPEYKEFLKWQTLGEMNAKGVSINVIEGGSAPMVTVPVR